MNCFGRRNRCLATKRSETISFVDTVASTCRGGTLKWWMSTLSIVDTTALVSRSNPSRGATLSLIRDSRCGETSSNSWAVSPMSFEGKLQTQWGMKGSSIGKRQTSKINLLPVQLLPTQRITASVRTHSPSARTSRQNLAKIHKMKSTNKINPCTLKSCLKTRSWILKKPWCRLCLLSPLRLDSSKAWQDHDLTFPWFPAIQGPPAREMTRFWERSSSRLQTRRMSYNSRTDRWRRRLKNTKGSTTKLLTPICSESGPATRPGSRSWQNNSRERRKRRRRGSHKLKPTG